MNRLKNETSPYLIMHALQPVHWFPWCDEAFEMAKKQRKPIFLSIGYSACHWCHVMSRECFENPTIARLLNEGFISIKVDREERPDIDSVYMNAIQLLIGEGGWPLSAFLNPEGEPFYGGTYFPPEPRYGLPSFPQLLDWVRTSFEEKSEDISHNIATLRKSLLKMDAAVQGGENKLSTECIENAVNEVESDFDPVFGGFGDAPKFPHVSHLEFLSSYQFRTREVGVRKILEKTLQSMSRGGLFDQVGGGFHRYSTDRALIVPHFEKMLYDNGLLLRIYSNAFRIFKREIYRDTARRTGDFLLREMRDEEGGFFATQHADSEGEEGKYYVFKKEDPISFLSGEFPDLFACFFGLDGYANFDTDSFVLHHNHDSYEDRVVPESGLLDMEDQRKLEKIRELTYEYRKKRVPPETDTKIILAWNAMAIDGLLHLFEICHEQRFLDAAIRCFEFIETRMKSSDGILLSIHAQNQSKFPAYLDDYAYYIRALIHLHRITQRREPLLLACSYQEYLNQRFYDSQTARFYFTSDTHESLFYRESSLMDHSIPSGQGICLENLGMLAELFNNLDFERILAEIIQKQGAVLKQYSRGCTQAFNSAESWLNGNLIIKTPGSLDMETRLAFFQNFHPGFHLVENCDEIGISSSKNDFPSFMVCSKHSCSSPMNLKEALARLDD